MNNIDTMTLENEITLKSEKQPHLTMWTLMWAGLWTGILSYGFMLLMMR